MLGVSCSSMGLGGWLLMVGLWSLLLVAVVWAVSRIFPRSDPPRFAEQRSQTDELLDHRLAAGEIDTDTYRRVRAELESSSSHYLEKEVV